MSAQDPSLAEVQLGLRRLEQRSNGIRQLIEDAFEERRRTGVTSLEPEEIENLSAMSEQIVSELGAVLEAVRPGHRRFTLRAREVLDESDRLLRASAHRLARRELATLGPKPKDTIRERRRPQPRQSQNHTRRLAP